MSLRGVHANAYTLPGIGKYACTNMCLYTASYFSGQNHNTSEHVHTSTEQMIQLAFLAHFIFYEDI